MPFYRLLLVLAVAVSAVAPARGQLTPAVPELVTDRPDQTESAAVVPRGFVQVETGVALERQELGRATVDTLAGPGTLVRIGLGHRSELRLGWEGWIEEEVDRPRGRGRGASGAGAGELGAKVRLRDEDGARPEMALLGSISLPIGDDEVASDDLDPALRVALSHTLSDRLGLAYNLGVEGFEEEGRHARFVYTVALGAELRDRLGAFVELFGDEPLGDAPGGSPLSFDGGVTYLLRPNLQLDAYAGAGLAGDAPDWLAGLGLSYRWPR